MIQFPVCDRVYRPSALIASRYASLTSSILLPRTTEPGGNSHFSFSGSYCSVGKLSKSPLFRSRASVDRQTSVPSSSRRTYILTLLVFGSIATYVCQFFVILSTTTEWPVVSIAVLSA